MTNEEAKVFLDNLKVCIDEHPVVADWLVEIADRKTEPQYDIDKGTIKCDNCSESGSYKCSKCDGEMYFKRLEIEDEPQTETEIAKAIVHKMIDDAVIAEDAYPDLRQKMHDAVDEYEPQTEAIQTSPKTIQISPQTDCSWK